MSLKLHHALAAFACTALFTLLSAGCTSGDAATADDEPQTPDLVEQGPDDDDAPEEFSETESGLRYRVRRASDGDKPAAEDTVTVHYRGWLDNGNVFDSSYQRGVTATFPLNGVISGWTEGMQLIGEGGMIELEVPSDLGYGDRGRPPRIPGGATLHFLVELIEIEKPLEPGPVDADAPEEFTTTESGLKYRVRRASEGDHPTADDTVTVHYRGWLDNETVFDSSYERGEPISFPLGGVIDGWTEGVQLIGEGGMIELEIPSNLGYGERGSPPDIPGGATLHFIVELISILKPLEPGPVDENAPEEFTATDSGLKYRILRAAEGASPAATDTVTVHYKGWLDDGTVFDSSYQRGESISFPLNGVIAGWTEGLQLVNEGGMIELEIPSNLGYGARGAGGVIPPNATLHFIVELIEIE